MEDFIANIVTQIYDHSKVLVDDSSLINEKIEHIYAFLEPGKFINGKISV